MFLRTGQLTARENFPFAKLSAGVLGLIGRSVRSGDGELAFLGNPPDRLSRALDTVLAIIAFRGKLTDHLIGAAGSRPRNVAGSKVDRRSYGKFVLQRPLHHTESRVALSVPMHVPAGNPDGGIACTLKHWPVTSGHGK